VTDGTSYEIDQRVKAILQEGLSVYRVDAELLRRLQPDFIVTQAHCEVCAVSLRDVQVATQQWLGSGPEVISLQPNNLKDIWDSIHHVAEVLAVPASGRSLLERLRRRVDAIAQTARGLPDRPTVACIEWIDPLMAAGNWMPELVALAGGQNTLGEAGRHSPWMTWGQLRDQDPEFLVILPCGFDLALSRKETYALTLQPGWSSLQAVRHGHVFVADGNQFFNRPGPRIVESLEILAEILHPSSFNFGHAGTGWEPFPVK
jgi:iron complex transport system substrate-binding protein